MGGRQSTPGTNYKSRSDDVTSTDGWRLAIASDLHLHLMVDLHSSTTSVGGHPLLPKELCAIIAAYLTPGFDDMMNARAWTIAECLNRIPASVKSGGGDGSVEHTFVWNRTTRRPASVETGEWEEVFHAHEFVESRFAEPVRRRVTGSRTGSGADGSGAVIGAEVDRITGAMRELLLTETSVINGRGKPPPGEYSGAKIDRATNPSAITIVCRRLTGYRGLNRAQTSVWIERFADSLNPTSVEPPKPPLLYLRFIDSWS